MTMTDPLPEPTIPPGHLFCFGMGYTGRRLARRLIDRLDRIRNDQDGGEDGGP